MRRPLLDEKIERVVIDGFAFPLGVYPAEPMEPTGGYVEQFEAADGGGQNGSESEAGGGDWEEWPDRFVYDVVLSATRLRALARGLFALLPGRVYPILDVLGSDAFREIDPYLAYDLVGIERFSEGVLEMGEWLFEDGMVGFGAMSLSPFIYVFVDEHKIVTIRAETDSKDRIEKMLAAFDLRPKEEIQGADSAEHEHRSVLITKPASKAMSSDEIVERLRDLWNLQLNIDTTTNVDDAGNELGVTGWQCVVRAALDDDDVNSYAEVLLTAESLEVAERLASEAVQGQAPSEDGWDELDVIRADRVSPEQYGQWVAAEGGAEPAPSEPAVSDVRWLAGGPRGKRGRPRRAREQS